MHLTNKFPIKIHSLRNADVYAFILGQKNVYAVEPFRREGSLSFQQRYRELRKAKLAFC